jgi:aryl-alcohol dehydrogenase-like predicted oxidoreductase
MNTINLGGIAIKRIGLGTNRIAESAESREILRYAVKRGMNFIDMASVFMFDTYYICYCTIYTDGKH